MFNDNGWRRFTPSTNDSEKLQHIGELIQTIGKEEIMFLLQNLKLNPTSIVDRESVRDFV